ncbi:MAG TPA: hypothetical protein VMS60_07270 [Solirubrobacterales bacterium]|nr:hypothetical protein [Solirubrobacterales bacterium]
MSRGAKLLIAGFVACLVLGAGTASAFVWHMTYGQAKSATKEFAKESCREDSECVAWGVGKCTRRTESGFACEAGLFFRSPGSSEEVECDIVLHWGADHAGYVKLKRHGPPHCFPV